MPFSGRPWACVHCELLLAVGPRGLVEVETGRLHRCPREPLRTLTPCRCGKVTIGLRDGSVLEWPGNAPHLCTGAWTDWSALLAATA